MVGFFCILPETPFPQRWTKLGCEFCWVSKTPGQAPPAASHLQPPPATTSQSQDNKTQSSLAMGQILPSKTPLTSRGLEGWLTRTAGFVSIFHLGCNAESPSGQWGWSRAVKAPGLPVGEQLWGWHWALGYPVCAAMGRRRNVGMALGTTCHLEQGSFPHPFLLGSPRPAEGREDFCDSGVHWPLCAGLSRGELGKGVKTFSSPNWRLA